MPGERYVFLDFDDTLSDPFQFHIQYVREVGALLDGEFGGSAEGWAKAAIDMLESVEREYVVRFQGSPLNGYCAWLADVRGRSMRSMFQQMNIAAPEDAACVARDMQRRALARCSALFPGAETALDALHAGGFHVHTASGQESEYLTAALAGAGIDARTGMKFGPDLIDCAKEGPDYYARVFETVGARASDCVVVDDYPPAIEWALQAGAHVLQSKLSRERHYERSPGVADVVTALTDLPRLVESIFERQQPIRS